MYFAIILTPLYVCILFLLGEMRRVICVYAYINPEITTLSFPLFSLFLHSFLTFHTLSPFSLFHFRTPRRIYLCMYICIYNSESSRLILEEKARESKVTPASDISPS